ncbi:MAG: hypothetical protein ABSA72_06765 [Nitrososphaerales archaeon]
MRASAVVGAIFLLVGIAFLYLLRHLLLQVIVAVVGIIGLVIAFVFILVGLGLIFGRFLIRGRIRRFMAVEEA